MPVSAAQHVNQSGFDAHDAEMLRKLIALFDSPSAGEAGAAFRTAVQFCAKRGLRFGDSLAEISGLAEIQELLEQRETQGGQLADALDELRREFAAYRQNAETKIAQLTRNPGRQSAAPNPGGIFCRGCEWKRRILALAAAWPIAVLWFLVIERSDAEVWQHLLGVILAASPLVGVLLRWRWLLFRRKYSWVSRKDNDIYRAIAARWNGFLERISMN
jgi:hypothetical protein